MRLVQRYVAVSVLSSCLVVAFLLVGLDFTFRLIDEVDNIGGDYGLSKVFIYELLRTITRVYEMTPTSVLIGCLIGLGGLANSSELVVMRTAGISTVRLVWAALKPALLLLFIIIAMTEYVAPKAERYAKTMRTIAQTTDERMGLYSFNTWLREGDNFLSVQAVKSDGSLQWISIFEFDNHRLLSITYAKRANYFDGQWLLEEVERFSFTEEKSEWQRDYNSTYRWASSLDPKLLVLASIPPDMMSMRTLYRYSNYLKSQGLYFEEYELAFWKKAFYPLVVISLVLIAISFVFGPLREVTMGFRIFLGVVIGVLVKTMQDALVSFSLVFGLSPIVAMLLPALICSLVGIIVLSRVR